MAKNISLHETQEQLSVDKRKWFWISIRIAKQSVYSRRNGIHGKIIMGLSVCLRLFNIDIL